MQRIGLETHVKVHIYDPLPTSDEHRADGKSDTLILTEMRYLYGTDLIAVTIYEVEVVEIDGIVYRSQPLNTRRATVK